MKVTEQIDAMEASAVNPYKFLVWTRVLACVLMLPLLTLAADLFGILGGRSTHTLMEPISLRLFLENGFKTVTFNDFFRQLSRPRSLASLSVAYPPSKVCEHREAPKEWDVPAPTPWFFVQSSLFWPMSCWFE